MELLIYIAYCMISDDTCYSPHGNQSVGEQGSQWHGNQSVGERGSQWHSNQSVGEWGSQWHGNQSVGEQGSQWHSNQSVGEQGSQWHSNQSVGERGSQSVAWQSVRGGARQSVAWQSVHGGARSWWVPSWLTAIPIPLYLGIFKVIHKKKKNIFRQTRDTYASTNIHIFGLQNWMCIMSVINHLFR